MKPKCYHAKPVGLNAADLVIAVNFYTFESKVNENPYKDKKSVNVVMLYS